MVFTFPLRYAGGMFGSNRRAELTEKITDTVQSAGSLLGGIVLAVILALGLAVIALGRTAAQADAIRELQARGT